jgi:hypothetical protein
MAELHGLADIIRSGGESSRPSPRLKPSQMVQASRWESNSAMRIYEKVALITDLAFSVSFWSVSTLLLRMTKAAEKN